MQGDEERRAIITLDKLNTDGRIKVDRDELRAAVRVAKAAINKQITMKPVQCPPPFGDECECPICESAVDYLEPYCCYCGQALDWDSFI